MEQTQTNLGPSLADLDKESTPAEQAAEALQKLQAADKAAQDKADADKKAQEDAASKQAEEIAKLVASGKSEDEAKAELKARENETPEQKTIRETAEAKKAEEEAVADQAGAKDAEEFFANVDKLHGFTDFKVEYPENVAPESEEGVHIREVALLKRGKDELENDIKQSDPRGYSYLLHRAKGGDDESFFAKPSVTLPEYEVFKNDVDLQKNILVKDLKNKGVDDDIITLTVDKAIKEKKLFEKADTIYKQVDTSEKKALADAEKEAATRKEAESKAVTGVVDLITDIVNNNKTEKIQIPDTKKAAFIEALKQQLMFDGENFFFMETLSRDKIAAMIEHRYFSFVGGNLSELVQRRASSVKAQSFKLGAKKETTPVKSGKEIDFLKGNTPVGDL